MLETQTASVRFVTGPIVASGSAVHMMIPVLASDFSDERVFAFAQPIVVATPAPMHLGIDEQRILYAALMGSVTVVGRGRVSK